MLDVLRVGDIPELPLAVDDPDILMWAEREERILVTEDRHTMANHLRGCKPADWMVRDSGAFPTHVTPFQGLAAGWMASRLRGLTEPG